MQFRVEFQTDAHIDFDFQIFDSPKREACDSLLRSADSSPHSAGDSGLATTTTTGSTSSRTKFNSTKLSSSGGSNSNSSSSSSSNNNNNSSKRPEAVGGGAVPAPAASASTSAAQTGVSPASAGAAAPATSTATTATTTMTTGPASSGSGSNYDPVPLYSNIDYNYYLDSKAQAHLLPLQQYILEQAKVCTWFPLVPIGSHPQFRVYQKNPCSDTCQCNFNENDF